MKMKQTATLGLSALLLSGGLLSPVVEAVVSQTHLNTHAPVHSGSAVTGAHTVSKASPLKHPIIQTGSDPIHSLQDLRWVFSGFNHRPQISKTTALRALHVLPVAIRAVASSKSKTALTVTTHSVLAQKKHPRMISLAHPTHRHKPPIHSLVRSIGLPTVPLPKAHTDVLAFETDSLAPMKETHPLPTMGEKSQPVPVLQPASAAVGTADIPNKAVPKVSNPFFAHIYPTQPPYHESIAAKTESKASEVFSLLAASPLDKLVTQAKGANMLHTPHAEGEMDFYNGNGSVKILKSGISQKMTNVDLAVGKAEVIYLSRPASRVSLSNPEVANAVIISPTQIQLIGKAVGVSNLLIWGDMTSPDHTVVDVAVHKDVSVLVNQLKYVDPGIQIVPLAAEDTVILTGQAESRESAQLAIEMAKAFFNKNNAVGIVPGASGPNSQAPGSAFPGGSTSVINLIKIKGEPSTKIELVRQKLHEIDPNIHLEVVPGPDGDEKVILTGRVPTASIASKALNLVSVFYGQPGMKMVTAQGGNDFTRMDISSASSSSSSSSISSTSSGSSSSASASAGANLLQGSVVTDATGNVISMLEIAQKPQIRCSIKFLELNKTSLNALGSSLSGFSGNTGLSSWSGVQSAAPGKPIASMSTQSPSGSSFNSAVTRGGGSASASNTINSVFNQVYQNGITQVLTINNQFAVAIQALQERRQVRTLAEPTLTLLSGEQGSFLAGGEIPIAFVGGQGQVSIQYKEFGIRLNLLPSVTDDGKIQMQVAPEVSSLDQANGVSTNSISVPAFVTRRMNTTLLIEPGQSFILAGLYNQQDTNSMSRFPGLGSVPILGSFFRNSWSNKTKSEMMVLIRPEIIYSNTGVIQSTPVSLPAISQGEAISKK